MIFIGKWKPLKADLIENENETYLWHAEGCVALQVLISSDRYFTSDIYDNIIYILLGSEMSPKLRY